MTDRTQGRSYPEVASNAPSTTSLLSPSARAPFPVQVAFASAPKSSPTSITDSPYSRAAAGRPLAFTGQSISDKASPTFLSALITPISSRQFSLSPDPQSWGADISLHHPEPDDFLHNPDPRRDRKSDNGGSVLTYRGLTNLGCLVFLAVGLVTLFGGYPIISYFTKHPLSKAGGFNLGGINASGQIPTIPNSFGLIDIHTPASAYTVKSFRDGSMMKLVFSDEFNVDNRTFYPGDDPYWEAADLHYWPTNDLEWYDPGQVTTKNGALEITMENRSKNDLNYISGMVSSWNKFCFTGGMILVSVSLPGSNNVSGLWPAVWTMGNLGRAGYGASTDGLWPYSYDSCDVGTAPNQTNNGEPHAALVNGDKDHGGVLSYLPGQRLSRCTCKGEPHPGPVHSDGTYVGRSAPEIDIVEAQVTGNPLQGSVSQSAQWGPMNAAYKFHNQSNNFNIPNPSITQMNSYTGGVFQQATSGVTITNQSCYERTVGCFSTYGYEYKPGFSSEGGYIIWITENTPVWTLEARGMAADSETQISDRPIPQEPMYLLFNLAMSRNFAEVDFDRLTFPTTMRIDSVRVYQPKDAINIGCDPREFPTAAYINQYPEVYSNPNLTTWAQAGQANPKSRFLGQC